MKKEWFAGSGRNLHLTIKLEDALSAAHQGDCEENVKALSKEPYIAEQLAKFDKQVLTDELKEYGAWDADELANHDQNLQRMLWCACNDIKEENAASQ